MFDREIGKAQIMTTFLAVLKDNKLSPNELLLLFVPCGPFEHQSEMWINNPEMMQAEMLT